MALKLLEAMNGDWSFMVVSEPVGRANPDAFNFCLEIPNFTMIVAKDFRTCRKEFEQEDEEGEGRL